MNGFVVFVDLHVEGFDFLRIVGHDNRFLEVLFYEIAFVLGSQVVTPFAGELELLAVLDGFLEDFDTFGIRKTDEVCVDNGFEALDEAFVHELVEEE